MNIKPSKNKLLLLMYALAFSAFALLCLGTCATSNNALYNGLGRASDAVPFMEKARTGVLPSGLRYYLLENSMPAGRVFLTLAVNAGSVLETDQERGLAHFVEHMAFNGTERFPESELINYLRSLGMRFGPEVNAYTSYNETVYGIEVPVEAGRRVPDTALAVIDDWTRAVTFAPKDVDDERLVILEEHRSNLGAHERIRRQILPVLFRGSPYAERLPIGEPDVIQNAPASLLRDFYQKWYRPDNMALIIVGDFDAAQLESSLGDHFHSEAVTTPLQRPRYALPGPEKGGVRALVLTDPEYPEVDIELYYKQKTELPRSDLAGYRDDIVAWISGTVIRYRFDDALSAPETPFIWAAAGSAPLAYGSRYYVLTAQAKTGLSREVLDALLTVKESLSRYGFTEGEVEVAKRSLLSIMEQAAAENDTDDSSYYVAAFTRHFIEGETVPDVEWELAALKALLPTITVEELNAAIKACFEDDDLTVCISAPESEKMSLPTDAEIRAAIAASKTAVIAPPVSAAVSGEFLEAVPGAGVIVSETRDSETGAVRLELGNGMEVILKPTTNKNNEISFYALARGGTSSVPEGDHVSADLAAEMMSASGLGPYTRPELTRKLADKMASFSFWTSPFLRGFQGGAATNDFKTLLEMIYLGFTEPRIDADAVSVLVEQLRTRLVQEAENPDQVFSDELARTVYGNPRFHPLVLADLERIDIDVAKAFLERCRNPADYTFVFAGSLDTAAVRPLIETYLASIPPMEAAFDQWEYVDYMRPGPVHKEIRKGKEERGTVYVTRFVAEDFTEEKSAAALVLQEYLDIVFNDEIREALGGVYSISAWVSLSPLPRGELNAGFAFVCNPGRAEELASAAEVLLANIATGDIDADILAKSREALVREHEQSVQGNFYISQSYANSAVIYRSALNRLDRRPVLYQAVSAEDIRGIAGRLLETEAARIILYPEGWN